MKYNILRDIERHLEWSEMQEIRIKIYNTFQTIHNVICKLTWGKHSDNDECECYEQAYNYVINEENAALGQR